IVHPSASGHPVGATELAVVGRRPRRIEVATYREEHRIEVCHSRRKLSVRVDDDVPLEFRLRARRAASPGLTRGLHPGLHATAFWTFWARETHASKPSPHEHWG